MGTSECLRQKIHVLTNQLATEEHLEMEIRDQIAQEVELKRSLDQQVEALQKQAQHCSWSGTELQETISSLQSEIKEMKGKQSKPKVEAHAESCAAAKQQLASLLAANLKLRQDVTETEARNEAEITALSGENQAKMSEAVESLQQLRLKLKAKLQQLEETAESIEEATMQQTELLQRFDAARNNPDDKCQKGNSAFAELNDRNIQLAQELHSMRHRTAGLGKLLARVQVEPLDYAKLLVEVNSDQWLKQDAQRMALLEELEAVVAKNSDSRSLKHRRDRLMVSNAQKREKALRDMAELVKLRLEVRRLENSLNLPLKNK